jgi:serine/threonine-protein kinase
MIGEVISGRYRVTELIATGGMSSVYLGQHVHMLKRVAIKVLDPKAEQLPELVARFQREAIAGAHVQHPNIASATDFGQLKDGSYFLVLEYVPGITLNHIIARGPLPVQRAVAIGRQLASGLGAAHAMGVVHRDVKPTNVILVDGSNEVVKLIDFGFAKVRLSEVPTIAPPPNEPATPERLLTAAGVVLGTIAYLSPEAALGMASVDHRSDLYALGLILYELLSGKHPFEGTDPVRMFLQQRTQPPPPIATRTPEVSVPEPLEAVVRKLLQKDPNDRYQSASEVVSALDGAMMSLAFEMVPELTSLPEGGGLFGTGEVPQPRAAPQPPAAADAPPGVSAAGPNAPPVAAAFPPSPPGEVVGAPIPPTHSEPNQEPSAGSDPFDKLGDLVRRVPGVVPLIKILPQDGRFPPWAYVAMPVLGIFFVVVMVLLAHRSPNAKLEAARADQVMATPPDREPSAGIDRAPPVSPKPEKTGNTDAVQLDAAGWRMILRNAVREKDWAKGSDAVLTLLRVDREAFRDRDVQNGLRSVAVALEDAGGDPADKFFGALTNDTGSDGLDLLYDIARFRTWTKAGKRATDTLRRPEVMMRASPPLKALFEFREASCMAKRDTFGKLAEQGDDRALGELTSLRDAECRRRRDPCCFTENRALSTAIRTLKTRLSTPFAP